jgi:GGDEF domain-containing protein
MFISLKRYLESRPEQVSQALLRMIRLLLQGIERHAVKGDANDYAKFRADVRNVCESLTDRPTASEVLVLAGATVKALEQYNTQTTRYLHVQTSELQNMIAMLTRTMGSIASGSQTAVGRLQEIEQQLQTASMIEDFQTAKIRLSECLETLRSEIVRQREDAARQVSEMRDTLTRSQDRASAASGAAVRKDAVTGLPDRGDAEAAMLEAVAEGRRLYLTVFVLDRVDLVNVRFGRQAGDDMLALYAVHLGRSMTRRDRLFRWTGPAFVALIERDETASQVREEISRYANRRLSRTVMVGARSVLLPIAASWTTFPVNDGTSVQSLVRSIETFIHNSGENRAAAAGE